MSNQQEYRRQFLKWSSLSALGTMLPFAGAAASNTWLEDLMQSDGIKNINNLKIKSLEQLGEDAQNYLNGGADDLTTVLANEAAYKRIKIRARRLVDVSSVSTEIELFGQKMDQPILMSPVGFQQFFHEGGEVASAKAAKAKGFTMIASSVSNYSFKSIAEQSSANLWFQLYPSTDRKVTKILLDRAEDAGCKVLVLTVDTPVVGNRENSGTTLMAMIQSGELRMGNFEGILPEGVSFTDPSMTWEMINWLKANCNMKILLKGIVTREDAARCLARRVDGIIVSNHGGRQLDSGLSTIECLPEIVDEVKGRIPVLIDGGIRRGTDIFKALALGASAVCIGRPYCWGLGAMGQPGVELALDILKTELIRDMQLAGTTSIRNINSNFVSI
jgi:isopentenyl diphosphate isomerase/L-lactate dehydrogenase-like FMN-dependent dehydrogenase